MLRLAMVSSFPKVNPHSSSRGEKTCPTFRTSSVGSFQFNLSSHRGLHPPLLLPSGYQWVPAVGTLGSLLWLLACPLFGLTFSCTFFSQTRFQPAHPFPCFHLDLSHPRFRVGCPPFFHPCYDLIKNLLALFLLVLLHLLSSGLLADLLLVSYLSFPCLAIPCAKT